MDHQWRGLVAVRTGPIPKKIRQTLSSVWRFFVMALSSGNQNAIYSLTPQHAKRLQQYLTHQISEFEKENGEVKATWSPTIVSPVQRANPPMEGS